MWSSAADQAGRIPGPGSGERFLPRMRGAGPRGSSTTRAMRSRGRTCSWRGSLMGRNGCSEPPTRARQPSCGARPRSRPSSRGDDCSGTAVVRPYRLRRAYADPDEVSDYLRHGTRAFLAGDHASARAVFEALLLPVARGDINLGQHEMVEEVLSVDFPSRSRNTRRACTRPRLSVVAPTLSVRRSHAPWPYQPHFGAPHSDPKCGNPPRLWTSYRAVRRLHSPRAGDYCCSTDGEQ
jgi:hypothetical protein